jgi:hypothetical protein
MEPCLLVSVITTGSETIPPESAEREMQEMCLQSSDCRQNPTAKGRSIPIILDTGQDASVLTVDGVAPEVGGRFTFAGRTWRIVAYRRHARALVAVPECEVQQSASETSQSSFEVA